MGNSVFYGCEIDYNVYSTYIYYYRKSVIFRNQVYTICLPFLGKASKQFPFFMSLNTAY